MVCPAFGNIAKRKPLSPDKRDQDRRGRSTFLQRANEAARYLKKSCERPYRHAIVDEAQDLHTAQWRLLRAAIAEGRPRSIQRRHEKRSWPRPRLPIESPEDIYQHAAQIRSTVAKYLASS